MKVASKKQPDFPPHAAFPLLIFATEMSCYPKHPLQILPQWRSVRQKAPHVVREGMPGGVAHGLEPSAE